MKSPEEAVFECCTGFTVPQLNRIVALLGQIAVCEEDIIGTHWCPDCVNRWAKVWGLIAKNRAENARRALYGRVMEKVT